VAWLEKAPDPKWVGFWPEGGNKTSKKGERKSQADSNCQKEKKGEQGRKNFKGAWEKLQKELL